MIDHDMLMVAVVVLACVLALNLRLTFYLLARVRELLAESQAKRPPRPGAAVAVVTGKRLLDGAPLTLAAPGQASALLFLSSGCPKCRDKLPQIARLLAPAQQAGLALLLVSMEPGWRLRRFLRTALLDIELDSTLTALDTAVVRVARRDYLRLNPGLSAPTYLFIDHGGRVEAAGSIGDDDWQSLLAQLPPLGPLEPLEPPLTARTGA